MSKDYITEYFNLIGLGTEYVEQYKFLGRKYSRVKSMYKTKLRKCSLSEHFFDCCGGIQKFVKVTDTYGIYCYQRDNFSLLPKLDESSDIYSALFYRAIFLNYEEVPYWVDVFTEKRDLSQVALFDIDLLENLDNAVLCDVKGIIKFVSRG